MICLFLLAFFLDSVFVINMLIMYMREILFKEDVNENKYIKNYFMVNLLLFYFFLLEKGYL